MPRLFISYRRADSRKDAGRLYDRLAQTFGHDNVFKDVDDIPFGSDFRGVIAEAVGSCDVLLALIGRQWIGVTDEHDQRRLDNPGDFVRIEIETALERDGCTVIPVLVDSAPMPGSGDLPDSLHELAYKNAVIVRDDPDFHRDVDRLIADLKQQYDKRTSASPQITPQAALTLDIHAAIAQFYRLVDDRQWDDARQVLAEIRESGGAPRFFDLDQAEQNIWTEIERGECEKEYALLRLMAAREPAAQVWAALQAFWESYPDYDPDGITDRVRPVPAVAVPASKVYDILPKPFEWLTIPAGWETVEDLGRVEVATFEIAKYLVTNAQYQVFVDAEDGYRKSSWWYYSGDAIAWRRDHPAPHVTGYPGADLPRTNVTWYEAVAFCHWLSEQTGELIRLPTESQWQRAALGNSGRAYPWGDESPEWLRGVFEPVPVTQFPQGASPYGVMGMYAHEHEWCLTEPDDPYEVAGPTGWRVIWGGMWMSFDKEDWWTFRETLQPEQAEDFIAFRIVRMSEES